MVPKPLQKPHPPLYTGGTSLATYEMAGARGWGMFLPPLLPFKAHGAKHRCVCQGGERGRPATSRTSFTSVRSISATTRRPIEHEVKPALLNFLAFNASPVAGPAAEGGTERQGIRLLRQRRPGVADETDLRGDSEQEIGFIGTPEQVIGQIRRLREQAPVTELAIVTNFGGLEHWKVDQDAGTVCPPRHAGISPLRRIGAGERSGQPSGGGSSGGGIAEVLRRTPPVGTTSIPSTVAYSCIPWPAAG